MSTIDKLNAFASKHQVLLIQKGQCGFGRACVGFSTADGNYVDYNPMAFPDYAYVWPYDARLGAPEGVDAYHKHDCLAVLVSDDNYEAALEQLLKWIEHLEGQGELEISSFNTGATGVQAIISGATGKAIRFKNQKQVTQPD